MLRLAFGGLLPHLVVGCRLLAVALIGLSLQGFAESNQAQAGTVNCPDINLSNAHPNIHEHVVNSSTQSCSTATGTSSVPGASRPTDGWYAYHYFFSPSGGYPETRVEFYEGGTGLAVANDKVACQSGSCTYTSTATSSAGLQTYTFTQDHDARTVTAISASVSNTGTLGSSEGCVALNANSSRTFNNGLHPITGGAVQYETGDSITITPTSGSVTSLEIQLSTGNPQATSTGGGSVTYNITSDLNNQLYLNANASGSFNANVVCNGTPAPPKQDQTITFTDPADRQFVANGSVSLSATGGGSGNAITFASTTTDVCTVSGSTATIVKAGTCSITASQEGNANYNAAPDVSQSFVISKATPTFSFSAPSAQSFSSGGLVDLSAGTSSDSTGTITYTSQTTGVCSVSGTNAEMLTAGTCTIQASQEADDNYLAPSPVTDSFAINKLSNTITFATIADMSYGDFFSGPREGQNEFSLTATGNSAIGLGVTSDAGTPTFSTTGPCSIEDSNAGHPNGVHKNVVVSGVGICEVTAAHAGDGDYEAASPISRSFNISKGSQTIQVHAFTNLTQTYAANGTFKVTAISITGGFSSYTQIGSSSGQLLDYVSTTTDICTVGTSQLEPYYTGTDYQRNSVATVTMLKPGTCSLTASQAGDANYNEASNLNIDFTINGPSVNANQDVSSSTVPVGDAVAAFTPVSGSGGYGTLTFAVNPSLPDGLSFNTSNGEITGTPTTTTANATYTVSVNDEASQSTSETFALEVSIGTAGEISFTAPGSQTYTPSGSVDISASATRSTSDVTFASDTGSVCTVSNPVPNGATVDFVTAGTCTITASQASDGNYAAPPTVTQSFTINPADQSTLTATASPTSIKFGETSIVSVSGGSGTGAISYGVPSGNGVCTLSGNTVTATGVGTCSVTATKAGDTNYNETTAMVDISVGKASQSLAFTAPADQTYAPGGSVALTSTPGASGEPVTYASNDTSVCTVSGSTASFVSAGTCSITASQAGNVNYNAAADVTDTFGIGKTAQAMLTATASPTSIKFGETSIVSVSGGSGTGAISYGVPSGNGVCTLSGNTVTATGVGTCSVTATKAGDTNYNETTAMVDISVGQADQSLAFTAPADQTYAPGGSVGLTSTPGASGEPVTYASNDNAVCTVSGSTANFVSAGTCSITASQAGNANYNAAADVTDTFGIGKADQTITASASPTSITITDTSTLSSTSGSGSGAITYAITSGSSFCSLSGTTVTGLSTGTCTITATKAADTSYEQATSTVDIAVGKVTSATTLSVSNTSPAQGETVTYTATVTSTSSPTGSVSFAEGANTLCSNVPLTSGVATCDHAFANSGAHSVVAAYGGDASNEPSKSAATGISVDETVNETQQEISSFIQNRTSHILNNQPSLIGQVTGQAISGGGPLGYLAINGNEGSQNVFFSTSRAKILAARDGNNSLREQLISRTAQQRIDAAFGEPVSNAPSSLSSSAASSQRKDYGVDGQLLGFAPVEDGKLIVAEEESTTLGFAGEADAALAGSRAGTWDIWTEIYGSRSNVETSSSSLWVGFVGLHYFVDDRNVIGLIGQFDWSDETNSATSSKADGAGWMVGPYIAGQFKDQNLFYEASIRYGQSDNTISPVGTYEDDFDTTRWMASAKLSGAFKHDDITIRPEIGFTWYEETQQSYTDSLSNVIPESTVTFGELRFGPTFSRTTTLDDGTTFVPTLGINGVYNFDLSDNDASQGTTAGTEELRARISAGFAATNPDNGVTLTTEVFYDGLGVDDYETYGGRARLTIPLD